MAKASRVEAQCLKEKAEAFRVEARHWELKAKGEFRRLPSLFSLFFPLAQPRSVFYGAESEAEVTRVAEASSTVQTVLETEIGEHEALKSAARTACEALKVEGV